MKSVLIACLLIVGTNVAKADDSANMKLCNSMGQFAHAVMLNHQNGVPLDKVLSVANKAEPSIRRAMIKSIAAIYNTPVYNTYDYKVQAADRIRNEIITSCILKVVE